MGASSFWVRKDLSNCVSTRTWPEEMAAIISSLPTKRSKSTFIAGKVGYPYFGQLILDCLNRTEKAMTQEHAFKAAELCLIAQRDAMVVGPDPERKWGPTQKGECVVVQGKNRLIGLMPKIGIRPTIDGREREFGNPWSSKR